MARKPTLPPLILIIFFFNDTAPPETSPLPPHDALPTWAGPPASAPPPPGRGPGRRDDGPAHARLAINPGATQKPGPTPLGTSLGEPLEKINANDSRMKDRKSVV